MDKQRFGRTAAAFLLIALVAVQVGVSPTPAGADTLVGGMTFEDPVPLDNIGSAQDGWMIRDLSCPTADLCVALVSGYSGSNVLLTSTNPTGGPGAWTPTRLAIQDSEGIDAVSCPTTTFCAAVTGVGDLWTTNAPTGGTGAWSVQDFAGTEEVFDLSCPSSDLCLGGGTYSRLVRFELIPVGGGAQWSRDTLSPPDSLSPAPGGDTLSVSCPTESFCAAATEWESVFTVTNPGEVTVTWTNVSLGPFGSPPPSFYDPNPSISCPTASFCTVVDHYGAIHTSSIPTGNASNWTLESHSSLDYQEVSCTSSALCVAVAKDGKLSWSASPGSGVTTWSDLTLSGVDDLVSVACPTVTVCAAGDESGTALVSTNPQDTAPVWTSSKPFDGSWVTAVDCPTEQMCVAGDLAQNVLTTSNPHGGPSTWTVADAPSSAVASYWNSLSCASETMCVAVEWQGELVVSSNPTGGTAAWSVVDVPGTGSFWDVSCPTTTFCAAVDDSGHVATSVNPTSGPGAWTVTTVPQLDSVIIEPTIECPTPTLCIANDGFNGKAVSTDPTGGAAAWASFSMGTMDGLTGLSCASETLCVAVDNNGYLATSVNPAGGAWTVEQMVTPMSFSDVDCPAVDLCVASARETNRVYTSVDPAGGIGSWLPGDIDGFGANFDISCASKTLCVIFDKWGQMVIGTEVSARLRVTTSPPVPSRITLDGHVADTWGLEWVHPGLGSHEVCFGDVAGYETPPCQTFNAILVATTGITGTFTQRGYLHVTTSPPVDARISIDGHPADNWGLWTDIDVGAHEVCFGAAEDYAPPPCQNVNVTAGVTTNVTGTFTFDPTVTDSGQHSLRVTTSPPVPSRITVNGHPADSWGLEWVTLDTGFYSVCFGDVPGYATPECEFVSLGPFPESEEIVGTFFQMGTLKVTTSPPVAGTISIDGNPADAWGVWTDMAPGAHEVCFGYVPGYTAPACQKVVVTAGNTTQITGTYT